MTGDATRQRQFQQQGGERCRIEPAFAHQVIRVEGVGESSSSSRRASVSSVSRMSSGGGSGSKKLICAPVSAMDCADGVGECVSGTPQELGAPTFIRIDFDRNEVAGTERTTAIRQIDKSESQVLLQGCGHLGPMDQPDAFNDALLFFLKNHGL